MQLDSNPYCTILINRGPGEVNQKEMIAVTTTDTTTVYSLNSYQLLLAPDH